MTSLKFNMSILKPQVIVIQETKSRRKSQIVLKGYKIFELVRGDNGGGLMIACLASLKPILIFEGDCECEVLVIEIKMSNDVIRIIAGYGPQECAPTVVREKYRSTIEEQVVRTYLAGHMVLVAEDSNAKLGPEWILNDPHPMSENGRLLAGMITRQSLEIANYSNKCKGGPITRQRTVNGKVEKSCIDFVLMCQTLASSLCSFIIDSDGLFTLTKYTSTKGNPSVVKSDHFTLISKFEINWTENKPKRQEHFKLRDEEGLKKFKTYTTSTVNLRSCFNKGLSLENACNKWYKEVDKILHQCFKKVRVTDIPPRKSVDYEIYKLLSTIKQLKELFASSHEMQKTNLKIEIQNEEHKMAVLQGNKCKKIIAEDMGHLLKDGAFSFNDAWKLKKKIFPQCRDAPFAVYDANEMLITDYEGVLNVMKEEFVYRLRNRVINPEYQELKELKEYLCKLRLDIARSANYNKWTVKQLYSAINKLKTNKCKDPHGHINELYKNMGTDGILSLLDMLNYIKEELLIPSHLNLSNISTIYKGKGSKQNVINLRGIFKLPIVRNILDRLISFDEEVKVSQSMGQFQVGNQKERNIRDHSLVIHAVVNEARATKKKIDILFTDIKQCFDSIWLDEATNDLYDSGVVSRNLNLLYEGNSKTRMCVETNIGKSERVELNKVVMQGSVPGGLICSNQLSKICNKLYSEGNVYMYRGQIPIPPLAMVDDVVAVNECNSTDALACNIKIDTFVQRKKLESQVGDGKCQWVHSGEGECRSTYHANNNEITQTEIYKYLGDHVADGWEPLYSKRWEKAQGYIASCLAMCTEMSLGYQLYHIAKLYHQSIFINGTLINMETWPNCTTARIESFERIEQFYFKKILAAHSKTPIESVYLELGVIPIRFHLMKRRIMYLHVILNRSENEITKKVIRVQEEGCLDGDFLAQTKRDMQFLSITDVELRMSKESLKAVLLKKVNEAAFQFLIAKASQHSKVNASLYTTCEGANYFRDQRFTPDLANLLFKFRTRGFLVKNNFRNNYRNTNILCPLCEMENDTQEHLFECKVLNHVATEGCSYKDIFSNDNEKLLSVANNLKKIVGRRETVLNPER